MYSSYWVYEATIVPRPKVHLVMNVLRKMGLFSYRRALIPPYLLMGQ